MFANFSLNIAPLYAWVANIVVLAFLVMVALGPVLASADGSSSRRTQTLLGALLGCFAVLAMVFPAHTFKIDGFQFDLRQLPILLSGFLLAPIGAATTVAFAILGRISIGGEGVLLGLIPIFAAASAALLFRSLVNRGYLKDGPLAYCLLAGTVSVLGYTSVLLSPESVRAYYEENVPPAVFLVFVAGTTLLLYFLKLATITMNRMRTDQALIQRYNALVENLSEPIIEVTFRSRNMEQLADFRITNSNRSGYRFFDKFDLSTSSLEDIFFANDDGLINFLLSSASSKAINTEYSTLTHAPRESGSRVLLRIVGY